WWILKERANSGHRFQFRPQSFDDPFRRNLALLAGFQANEIAALVRPTRADHGRECFDIWVLRENVGGVLLHLRHAFKGHSLGAFRSSAELSSIDIWDKPFGYHLCEI